MRKKGIEAQIKGFLTGKGIPITGISAMFHIPKVPGDFSPQTILKGAKSIICYGVPIPKGVIYADSDNLALYCRY